MQLTIPKAAKLYGKHRSTIHRHIESGRLSCGFRGDGTRIIEMSELIRCYGEPKHIPDEMQPPATPPQEGMQQAMLQALQAMHKELVALREEVAQLKHLPPPKSEDSTNQDLPTTVKKQDSDPHGLRSLARSLYQDKN
ncbi:helix-turn-helix domain-containing protein [Larsenimonas salina]|uniref:helix-turn-helix domain-containing protein n=1 Tax=Larsenimonas salina TaxID=1295565 RepID=UPI00207372B6|nr:helix-turn-helix domain-containing protein [Larsenimonas salina]MCM5705830.1 helix-turn-helix domain-containing protein [Larsenimonas salina]